MPQFKIDTANLPLHLAGDGEGANLYMVVYKVGYGWLSDDDGVALVRADNETQAMRVLSARYVVLTGNQIPLDDKHMFAVRVARQVTPQLPAEDPVVSAWREVNENSGAWRPHLPGCDIHDAKKPCSCGAVS